jgi:hypothetical protein
MLTHRLACLGRLQSSRSAAFRLINSTYKTLFQPLLSTTTSAVSFLLHFQDILYRSFIPKQVCSLPNINGPWPDLTFFNPSLQSPQVNTCSLRYFNC